MNDRIEQVLESIGKRMQGHLANRNFDGVAQLSTVLMRAQQLHKQGMELEHEISKIEEAIKLMNGKTSGEQVAGFIPSHAGNEADQGGRAAPQTLRIEIDWKANGKGNEKEVIFEPMAADSMVRFLGRLVEEYGQEAIQKLRQIRVNRGPLLSKTPETDYINQTQGRAYGNKRLRGTDYFVLTHSQTTQKADDLNRVCKVLGMVPGSVQIRVVERTESYKELYAKLTT